MQERMQHKCKLGVRLWRYPAMGGYTEAQKRDRENVFKVFVTYTKQAILTENGIKVNH